ncbi:anthranilate synthase component I family protein [Butyricicoccus sp.]|uniref:anthranilate synthase component I family protein n=1 Tax=Butyricicoccus sp. TaxID=2049021 RepID=UPI003F138C88
MLKPTASEIQAYAADYSTIPLCREIYADITTPIALLRKIAQVSDRYFLLESVEGGERWGRYSFLGFDPIVHVTCKDHVVTTEYTDGHPTETVTTDTPNDVLRALMAQFKAPRIEGFPPFTGGLVGYYAYRMIGYAEPTLKLRPSDVDDFDLMLFDKVIAYDHLSQKIDVIVNMRTDDMLENYGTARAEIEKIIRLIREPMPLPVTRSHCKPNFTCNVTKEQYCDIVNKTKQYIVDGDIFQAVLSRRFETPYTDSLLDAYRVLRTTNPSPYMVYLHQNDIELMSTSPETLVRLRNGRLATFPVAGSRPRGATQAEDQALEADLLSDEKELAEHNMLVDLGRNDIGRLSEFGSVEVTDYQMIHRYSRIMHITSVVEGDIKPEFDAFDAISTLLPAGTLSGAPKIRACEIIEELEPCARGVYGGALGYVDFTGNMDTCIAIRMAVKKNDRVTVQAGGGIVADSVPENEYMESQNKAGAVISAIERAAEVDAD